MEAEKNIEIVVFDFDKTLTYKDTVFGFFWAASEDGMFRSVKALFYWVLVILAKLGFTTLDNVKNRGIKWFLAHHDRESLDVVARKYAHTIALNRLYHTAYEENREHALIVSASLDVYLKHLFLPEKVVAAELAFDGNNHPECMAHACQGTGKVERLKQMGITRIHKLYTDSKSDAPLAEIADEIYWVQGDEVTLVDSLA